MTEKNDKKQLDLPGEGSSDFIKIIAWIYLALSIIGGLNLIVSGADPRGGYSSQPDQVMINWGIGVIFSGVVFMALCQVVAAINLNIRTIAKNSFNNPSKSEID